MERSPKALYPPAGKLAEAIIATFLGVAILISRLVSSGLVLPGYWQLYYTNPTSNQITPLLLHWPGIEYPNVWLMCYFALGVAITGCGIAQIISALGKKDGANLSNSNLALAQIVLGCIFIALCIWYLVGVEPDLNSQPLLVMAANGGVTHDPLWIRLLLYWKIAVFVLGAAVVWFGTNRFRRERGLRVSSDSTQE